MVVSGERRLPPITLAVASMKRCGEGVGCDRMMGHGIPTLGMRAVDLPVNS